MSLANYDCIIYCLLDYGILIELNKEQIKAMENHIKNGGNIIVTHDHPFYVLSDNLGIERVGLIIKL